MGVHSHVPMFQTIIINNIILVIPMIPEIPIPWCFERHLNCKASPHFTKEQCIISGGPTPDQPISRPGRIWCLEIRGLLRGHNNTPFGLPTPGCTGPAAWGLVFFVANYFSENSCYYILLLVFNILISRFHFKICNSFSVGLSHVLRIG
jgi:hypothetical protein